MMGAIIGDIVGSVYEWNNIKTKEFPLFQDKCRFTDDTVMTVAVAEGLMNAARLGGQGSFSPLEAEGLDAAWTNSRLELVAVKGNLVISITYMPGSPDDFDPLALCEALAERWARER